MERHLAPLQRVDLGRDDVADHDLVAELCEARARHKADPAGAEDAHLAHFRAETYFTDVRGLRPLAMEIIVSLDNESRSVLTTQ